MSRQVELQVRLELLSDTIFGSGHSIPGGEDIAVCQDENGYPYLKGTTFKGLLRESMHDLLEWSGGPTDTVEALLGKEGWTGTAGGRHSKKSRRRARPAMITARLPVWKTML